MHPRYCKGCSVCDPEIVPRDENELQLRQRRSRENARLLREGKPTLKVSIGDLVEKKRSS